MIVTAAAGRMISDAVLNNLITTAGTVVTAIVTLVTVIKQGRKTRNTVKQENGNVKDHIARELKTMRSGGDPAAAAPSPDVNVPTTPAREPRRRLF